MVKDCTEIELFTGLIGSFAHMVLMVSVNPAGMDCEFPVTDTTVFTPTTLEENCKAFPGTLVTAGVPLTSAKRASGKVSWIRPGEPTEPPRVNCKVKRISWLGYIGKEAGVRTRPVAMLGVVLEKVKMTL